jgi:hypothetical protein
LGNRIVEFVRAYRRACADAARDQHLAVVRQRQTEVAAARGDHLRGERRKSIGRGIEFLGRIQVAAVGILTAGDQHGAIEIKQLRRGSEGARLVEGSGLGDGVAGGIENLGAGKRSGRIRAACDQHGAVVQKRGGMILPSVLQIACHRKCLRGRIVDLKAGELTQYAASARDQDGAILKQRGGVMAAREMHRRQPDECVLRRIVEFCVRDRPAKLVEPARKQDGFVVENGRSETGDGGVKASRQLRESVAREAVNFSTRERAGAADTADDQRLAARKHRGGVIGARGVEVGGNRPYAGRLRRCWKRKHQDDEQRLQDYGANATRGSAATLID